MKRGFLHRDQRENETHQPEYETHASHLTPPFLYELGASTNRAGTKPIRFRLARRRGHSTEIQKRDDQEKNG
jgi:hypothetical protein